MRSIVEILTELKLLASQQVHEVGDPAAHLDQPVDLSVAFNSSELFSNLIATAGIVACIVGLGLTLVAKFLEPKVLKHSSFGLYWTTLISLSVMLLANFTAMNQAPLLLMGLQAYVTFCLVRLIYQMNHGNFGSLEILSSIALLPYLLVGIRYTTDIDLYGLDFESHPTTMGFGLLLWRDFAIGTLAIWFAVGGILKTEHNSSVRSQSQFRTILSKPVNFLKYPKDYLKNQSPTFLIGLIFITSCCSSAWLNRDLLLSTNGEKPHLQDTITRDFSRNEPGTLNQKSIFETSSEIVESRQLLSNQQEPIEHIHYFALIFLLCLITRGHYRSIKAAWDEIRQWRNSSQLVSSKAQSFAKRYHRSDKMWAASVGLRTATYSVNHDPSGALQAELPATFMQIRTEEVHRCIRDLLGEQSLYSSQSLRRIEGAIDPEYSLRPCVDALNMLVCLYLEASSLVERRLHGLLSLLPIIDPGLGKILPADLIAELAGQQHWFYHLRFAWIDQIVIRNPGSSRYQVSMDHESADEQHQIMNHLAKSQRVYKPGVWFSLEGRTRLVREAPSLSSIIKAHPIAVGDNRELLFFTIEFEALIPRLEQYYGLAARRQKIADFAASQESQKIADILSLRIKQTEFKEDYLAILDAISRVPWRGFTEKNRALELILQVHSKASQKTSRAANYGLAEDTDDLQGDVDPLGLRPDLLELIESIGYPSQILHHAQLSKIELRDFDKLFAAALHPGGPRFEEAWLLISGMEYERTNQTQLHRIFDFLNEACLNPDLRQSSLAFSKTIDAITGITLHLKIDALQLRVILNNFRDWFQYLGISDEALLAHYLDAILFLMQIEPLLGAEKIDQEQVDWLAHHINSLITGYLKGSPAIGSPDRNSASKDSANNVGQITSHSALVSSAIKARLYQFQGLSDRSTGKAASKAAQLSAEGPSAA